MIIQKTRPIMNINSAIKDIALGYWITLAEHGRIDEAGQLARSFNIMTRQLKELFETLEQKVADRTKALSESNLLLEKEIAKKKNVINQLQIAMEDIKILRGILPICSHCKKNS